jgi:TRAP-type mannitol/chloroaromatic compound transport system permease small subunit
MTRKPLYRLGDLFSRCNEWIGRAVAWLSAALVALVCFDVIVRYWFSDTKAWIMELEWHFFALMFLLGAGYAFRHDRHVRVDLFYGRMTPREKAQVNLVGGLLFLLPWCAVICYYSMEYALSAYRIGETSPDPGGLPARYLIKMAIPLGMFLLFLQGLASVIDALGVLRGETPPPPEESVENLL